MLHNSTGCFECIGTFSVSQGFRIRCLFQLRVFSFSEVWDMYIHCVFGVLYTCELTPRNIIKSPETIPIRRRDIYIWHLADTGLDYS